MADAEGKYPTGNREPNPSRIFLHGVDIACWPGGLVSAAHTEEDIDRTVKAFESTFAMFAEEGGL